MIVHRKQWPRAALWLIPAVFFSVFFVYPTAHLIVVALQGESGWQLGAFWAALTDAGMLSVAWFTIWQAAVSTLLTLLVALPGAWVLAKYQFRGRGLVEALSVVAFVMPSVVVATAVSVTLAPDGPLGWLLPEDANRGLGAIFFAHIYFNVAVVLRVVSTYWRQLDPQQEQAAATLGANPLQVFTSVTLRRLWPAILASGAIVYLFTFTSFGIILLLGKYSQATIEVEIQRQVLFLFDLPVAAALSVVQIVFVVLLLWWQARLSDRLTSQQDLAVTDSLPRPTTGRSRIVVAAFLLGATALFAGPVLLVIQRAFTTGSNYGLQNFAALNESRRGSTLFVSPVIAVGNSLMFALMATILAVLIGGMVAWSLSTRPGSARESLWLLPLGVSAVTLGFGMLISFDSAPLNLRGTPFLVPIAQALVAIPFVIRALLPVLRSIRGELREAAATLGATPWQIVRFVDWPIASRALWVAVGFSFAISLGEFGATLFVAPTNNPTVPIAIYRFLGTPGETNQGQAMALASILIVMTAAVVLVTNRFRTPGGRYV
ncbi:MAG: iron ABC transporter permease [Actinomycetia bacterium]|nr:iron ABC transporter permease [Actinomycetes bacterium]